MEWNFVFGFLIVLVAVLMLLVYWFFPSQTNEFIITGPTHSNFTLKSTDTMQFYPNMRFLDSRISYKISDCSIKKIEDMKDAFNLITEKTSMLFYEVNENEEINVTCSEKVKVNEGLFIAGEGGPTKVIQTDKFNVILQGDILLLKDSSCINPNVAIHELLHVLGFDHSENQNNIMYFVSKCDQTIGDDIVNLLNQLYSIKPYPDLTLSNITANIKGNYLNTEFYVKNNGLKTSESGTVIIYGDDKIIKSIDLKPLEIGSSLKITLDNAQASRNTKVLKFTIKYDYEEIDKLNNEIVLQVAE